MKLSIVLIIEKNSFETRNIFEFIIIEDNMLKNFINKSVLRYLCATTKSIQAPRKYSQKISKARVVIPFYNHEGQDSQAFIAPNATIAGDVNLHHSVSIGYGTVIRGDINYVNFSMHIVIGDNCVLHTASSLPSGLNADLNIDTGVIVGSGCTLYSCTIEEGAFIGANTVILEGAKIQSNAIILPNSVVPPGRVVPANQVWGGNPIKFIRFSKDQQKFVSKTYAQMHCLLNDQMVKYQFIPKNNAYLYREDDPQHEKIRNYHVLSSKQIQMIENYNPNSPTH